MIPTQPVSMRCPQCGQPITAQLQTIVDVGMAPELKEALLRGQLNIVACPACGARARIGAPLLYHDAAHELAIAYVPMELNIPRDEQEKLIGQLSNALMDLLPAAQRRFYILNPRVTMTSEGLLEAIYEADGISREMLDAQAARATVLNQMLDVVDDEERLKELVDANKDTLDYSFFMLIALALEDAQNVGADERARRLSMLRDRLLALTGGPSEPLPEPFAADASLDEIIALLQAAEDDEFQELVAVNRPRFDYSFYQQLTDRIDALESAGQTGEAAELTDLRERLLNAAERVDREMQASLRQAAKLLEDIISSDDPQQVVQDRLDEIDDAFLLVLSANIPQAHEMKQTEFAQALEGLYAYILSRLEAKLPAELQLVNRLLRLDDPARRAEVLDSEASLVTPELAELLEQVALDAEDESRHDLAAQARAAAGEVRGRLG